MEIVVAPNRFQRILNVGLVGNSIKEITEAISYLRPDGLYIEHKQSPFLGVKAFFPTHYFINYTPGENEKICLTSTMLEPFGFHKAFEEEKLNIITKDNTLYYKSINKENKSNEFWRDELREINEKKFSFEMPDSDKGFMPAGKEPLIQALLEVSQLRVHPSKYYRFISDGKQLEVEVTDPGVYRRTLKLSKMPKLSEVNYQVPGAILEAIISLFTGEVWLTLYKKAVIMSQKTKESTITFLFVPRTE